MKIYLLFVSILVTVLTQAFSPSWGNYELFSASKINKRSKKKNALSLTHPYLGNTQLNIKTQSPVKLIKNTYYQSQYSTKNNLLINTITNNLSILVSIQNIEQQVQNKFTVKYTLDERFKDTHSSLSIHRVTDQLNRNYPNLCQINKDSTNNNIQYSCTIKPKNKYILNLYQTEQSENLYEIFKNNNTKAHEHQLNQFIKVHSIENEQLNRQMVEFAISSTIDSLCLWEDQYEQIFMGFCYQGKYQFKFAAYTIHLLSDYDKQLAKYIYENYLSLLQARIYYPTQQEAILNYELMPEYLDIFMENIDPTNPLREAILLQRIFVKAMLNRLNDLHEQANYRESKKLHPYIMQMLTQPWNYHKKNQAFKSIYRQSFTSDFKYHNYGEKLHQCQTKIGWLFKVLDTSTQIKINYLKMFMRQQNLREYLQQQFTILNLLQKFLNDDQNAKNGNYLDIIEVQNNGKFYPKTLGYGNLLTYLYIGITFPDRIFESLKSQYGLKSSSQQDTLSRNRFRGDIHSYFNLRIFQSMKQKLQNDKLTPKDKKQQIKSEIIKMEEAMSSKIKAEYKKKRNIFTSWNSDSQPKQSIQWLRIITVMLLRGEK